MKKLLNVIVISLLMSSCAFCQAPKYIFLFIGDGMGQNQRKLAEKISVHTGLGKLEMNHFPFKGRAYTQSANSPITDSAASGTAIACGQKTNNGMLGVTPDKNPVDSVAVDAKNAGWKVGIITTVPVNHATPASFYAHVKSRNEYDDIARQLADSGFDFFGGAGINWADKKEDIYEVLNKKGYTVAVGLEELNKLSATPAVAVERREGGQMSPRYSNSTEDHKSRPGVMTLADLTAKAVKLLDNPKGFFIMVEGGAIDWAGHNNDLPNNIWETVSMNDAVRVALDFAKKHPAETLIITTADHETGGLTITGTIDPQKLLSVKSPAEVSAFLTKIGKDKVTMYRFGLSLNALGLSFGDMSEKDKSILIKYWDSNKITGKESLTSEVMRMVCTYAGIFWTTGGHTGVPVTTTATGPGSEAFKGKYQNTHIAETIRGYIKQSAAAK